LAKSEHKADEDGAGKVGSMRDQRCRLRRGRGIEDVSVGYQDFSGDGEEVPRIP
jgi:hypothetical protein